MLLLSVLLLPLVLLLLLSLHCSGASSSCGGRWSQGAKGPARSYFGHVQLLAHHELTGWFRVKSLELREGLELKPFLSDSCLSASFGNVAATVLALFLSNLGLR